MSVDLEKEVLRLRAQCVANGGEIQNGLRRIKELEAMIARYESVLDLVLPMAHMYATYGAPE